MKKALMLAIALTTSVGTAAPFVYPAEWSDTPASAAKRGGEYRTATVSDFKTLNPFLSKESPNLPFWMGDNVGLFTLDPRNDEHIPYMAAELPKVSQNGKRFVVKIRKGMKYSDGKPITAKDWNSTFKIHMDKKVGSNTRDGLFINKKPVKLKVIDEYTLQFDFPEKAATALDKISFAPWPDHVFGAAHRKGGAAAVTKMWGLNMKLKDLVVPGAFKVTTLNPGQRVVLTRNEKFGEWNKDSAGKPLPYLERYSYKILGDSNAILAAYLAGQLDTFAPRKAEDLAQIKKAINSGRLKSELFANVAPTNGSQWIAFNWNKSSNKFKQDLFRETRFRRAMSHITNRKAMVQLALGGLGRESYSMITPAYKSYYSAVEEMPKYEYNLDKAKKLLAQIGFTKKDKNGYLVDKNGKRLEFDLTTNAGNTTREQISQIFVDEAKKVGVKVNFKPVAFNNLVDVLSSKGDDRKFDAILIGFTGSSPIWPFPSNLLPCGTIYHVWNSTKTGSCITTQEQLMTKLFYQGQKELDTKKRKAIGAQLTRLESEMQPLIYLLSPNMHVTYQKRIGGEYPRKLWSGIYGTRDIHLTYIK